MYSILFVDDEDEARKAIKEFTPWSDYGFETPREASNGREALEMIDDNLPDVIITDIRMPYMDGIEFIEKVRTEYSSSVDVIILSGYDEFTFAQTAMRLNVADYVLKPVSIESMKEVLKRTKERLDQDRAKVSDMAKLLSSVAVREVIEDAVKKRNDIICFQYESQIVLIFISDMEKSFSTLFSRQIFRTLSMMQSEFIHYFSRSFYIGLGEIVTSAAMLPDSYKSAMIALNYSSIYPEQHIIDIRDVESSESISKSHTGENRSELVMAIKFGNAEDTEKAVHPFFQGITETENIQNTVLSVLTIVSEICSSYGKNIATLLDGEDLFLALSHANTLSRAESLVTKLAIEANKAASGIRENSRIQFVENAKRIIKEKYSDPLLGLDQIAEETSVSPAYFSTTFKKETGLSFVQYLTNIRLEKAKEMLRNSDAKTYEIAEMTGFSEPNYFSFTFKKNVGVSPSQYRGGVEVRKK